MPERPVAGIDVSKEFSDMCVLSPTNTVFETAHIYHDPASMNRAAAILDAAAKKFGSKPVIVMESTGHYHRIIAQYFTSIGHEVLVINPMQSEVL